MIAYFASDLVWATRIKGVADDLGLAARPVRTIQMLQARLEDSDVTGLVVDLDAPETALALIAHLRAHEASDRREQENAGKPAVSPARIVAFGPHVETAALAEARALGADAALTRGAFHHQLAGIMKQVAVRAHANR